MSIQKGFYESEFPKVAFCNFPARHRQRIRTGNPIETDFAAISHCTTRSKECLSRVALLRLMIKLGLCAEVSLQKLRDFNYLSGVIADIEFTDRIETTINNQAAA